MVPTKSYYSATYNLRPGRGPRRSTATGGGRSGAELSLRNTLWGGICRVVAPVPGRRRRPPRPIRPRDPISVPAADASTLLILPPVMSLIGPALYLLASILILLTPTRNSMSLLAAPPLPPDPNSDDNANNQYSVNAAIDMDPSPEDDRLQVNPSVRSSSPPPRAGGGEAQNTSALVPLLGIVQLLGQMVWYLRTGECVGGLWCGAGRVV